MWEEDMDHAGVISRNLQEQAKKPHRTKLLPTHAATRARPRRSLPCARMPAKVLACHASSRRRVASRSPPRGSHADMRDVTADATLPYRWAKEKCPPPWGRARRYAGTSRRAARKKAHSPGHGRERNSEKAGGSLLLVLFRASEGIRGRRS
nr:unnamed protein product [Digitaria exilis]